MILWQYEGKRLREKMKGEKDMKTDNLTKELHAAQEAVIKAEEDLEKATEDLKKIVEAIEERAKKKPIMYFTNGSSFEIVKYRKYSDSYVEFETANYKYRYIKLSKSEKYTLPKNGLHCTLESHLGHVFEAYDLILNRYDKLDWIDHIELLEGVDEYDQT